MTVSIQKLFHLRVLALVRFPTLSRRASGQGVETAPSRTQRLSESLLLLWEISPMKNIVVAMAAAKGLVVVDATGSPYNAGRRGEVIEGEFGKAISPASSRPTTTGTKPGETRLFPKRQL